VRGSALVRLGRYGEARKDLALAEQSEYWFWAEPLWYLAGVAALQDGDLADGTARLEKYVEFEPGLVAAWQALEQAYTAQGREADAARARHNQATNLYLLALGSERAGDKPRALERLHRALAIVPEHPQAKEALARLGG
jgi:tetratricopeptide (TPR) repeat protein